MRYLTTHILRDLEKKMVFIGGPRQVGKTTLAQGILAHYQGEKRGGAYFNWDFDEHRRDILTYKWRADENLLIFDELHKLPRWKTWIKGLYDVHHTEHRFLVTGSARLDLYRRGGDSLLGRYHYWRLHPFSLSEIPSGFTKAAAFERLMRVGGFPEPFMDGDDREARRWRKERYERIIKDDIRDLANIQHLSLLSLLLTLLRTRVGSLVVAANLAEDLQVAPATVKKWIETLEQMYVIFSVKPYTQNLSRAIQKPPKIYFFDNADVEGDEGARFENLVATHLLKRIHFLEDRDGHRYELRYLRDKEKREVDFVILKDGKVESLVEAKYADDDPSRSLQYYAEKLSPPHAIQVVAKLKRSYSKGRLHICDPFELFLEQ